MIRKILPFALSLSLLILLPVTLQAWQPGAIDSTKNKIRLNLGADIVSRYLWRGTDFGNSPAIQPTLSLAVGSLEIGTWGSVATNNSLKEIDLFVKYSFKHISLIFTDYYIPVLNGLPAAPDTRFFTYDDEKTAHSLEASIMWKGSESFPLWLLGGVFFYGNDKRWGVDPHRDNNEETYYSTYIEAGYTFRIKENNADVFAAFTPWAGAYGSHAALVNIGVTGYRKIKITDNLELPVKASLMFNPLTSSAFLALGFTI